MSASEFCEKLPMAPVAGSMKFTSEQPMQKLPSSTSCPSTMAAMSVISAWVRHPASVIGEEAPPMGRVPTPTGMPARTAVMICSMWIAAKFTGSGVIRCRK